MNYIIFAIVQLMANDTDEYYILCLRLLRSEGVLESSGLCEYFMYRLKYKHIHNYIELSMVI